MVTFVSGIVALTLGIALWSYLRIRSRQLSLGSTYLDDFESLAVELVDRDMPERDLRTLVALTHFAGTGHVARYIFRLMVAGKLASRPSRERVAAWRKDWSAFHSTTRVLYVQALYSALRADSYFAGVVLGPMFRRAVFYLSADPAEIAKAADAWETKILMLGAEQAVEREAQRNPDPKPRELVSANC